MKEKFITTTLDSFDYSAFIFAGMLAGVAQAQNSYPEFHQGAAGYGRYYWHSFTDQAVENYNVEFIFPTVLRQDSRYYTLGRGGLIKRSGYSFSRILITRTNSGNETFNASEIVGAGAASGPQSLNKTLNLISAPRSASMRFCTTRIQRVGNFGVVCCTALLNLSYKRR